MSKKVLFVLAAVLLVAAVWVWNGRVSSQVAFRLADCADLGFSTEEDFVTQGPTPADGNPIISDGDLLGPFGRICARNRDLLAAFAATAPLPDLGLDAADVISIDPGLVAFSTELDDPAGQFTAGDLLTTAGAVIPNVALLAAFGTQGDLGLDGVHLVGDTRTIIEFLDYAQEKGRDFWVQNPRALPEILKERQIDLWFSTEGTGMAADGSVFLDGDLLSAANGTIVLANGDLLAPPVPAGLPDRGVDFGLDAVSTDCLGDRTTLGLSTEIGYQNRTTSFTDGDVLAFGGAVVKTNWDLVGPFEPRARMLGLDALTYPNLREACQPGRPQVSLDPSPGTVVVSGTVPIEIRVANIQHFYGAQVELAFDPSIVEVVDAYDFLPGVQIEEGDFPVPDTVITNQANNQAGTIAYAISLQGDKPGVDGSGTLAIITFHGLEEGTSQVSFIRSILSDPQSVPIDHATHDGQVTVRRAAGTVAGTVILERRTSNAGSQVCLDSRCVVTPEDGSYSFDNVTPGAYTVTASHMSYLRSWRPISVPIGLVTLPDVTLLGGDVNQDDHVELADAVLIGQAWNSTPAAPNWDERADITDDDSVNVLDMVAVQFNWDETAPGPWAGAARGRRVPPEGAVPGPEGLALATQVVISPNLATLAGVGETVELEVQVQDVTDLYAARVQLTFDPGVVRVRDADPRPSAPGVQIRPGDFLDPINQQVLVNEADNTAGTIDFAVTQTYPAEARSGSGVLATVEFEAVGEGSSAVHLASVRLLDDTQPDPVEIAAGTQDGRVMVGAAYSLYLPLITRGVAP